MPACSALGLESAYDSRHQPRHVALRIFTDRDGQQWRVWSVRPTVSGHSLRPAFREGWLCFERLDGWCRCRLSVEHAPDDWDSLPDDRLDVLREMAGTS